MDSTWGEDGIKLRCHTECNFVTDKYRIGAALVQIEGGTVPEEGQS